MSIEDFKKGIVHPDRGKSLSRQQFDAMVKGQTRTKFKMIVDPDTGKIFRLVNETYGISPGKDPITQQIMSKPQYYVEMKTTPTEVYHYRLSEKTKAEYLVTPLEPLKKPHHYAIKSFVIQKDPGQPLGEHELTRRQVYELDTAIGTASRWWTLEGLAWNASENQGKTEYNVLFDKDVPIGMIALEDYTAQTGKPTTAIAMLGLVPGQKGKGLGPYLMQWGIRRILDKNPATEITLTTSALDKKQSGKPAKEIYEKLGFVLEKTELTDPDKMIAAAKNNLESLNLYNVYISDKYDEFPDSEKKLPRFTAEELNRRLGLAFAQKKSGITPS